jgi:hypothetical protein
MAYPYGSYGSYGGGYGGGYGGSTQRNRFGRLSYSNPYDAMGAERPQQFSLGNPAQPQPATPYGAPLSRGYMNPYDAIYGPQQASNALGARNYNSLAGGGTPQAVAANNTAVDRQRRLMQQPFTGLGGPQDMQASRMRRLDAANQSPDYSDEGPTVVAGMPPMDGMPRTPYAMVSSPTAIHRDRVVRRTMTPPRSNPIAAAIMGPDQVGGGAGADNIAGNAAAGDAPNPQSRFTPGGGSFNVYGAGMSPQQITDLKNRNNDRAYRRLDDSRQRMLGRAQYQYMMQNPALIGTQPGSLGAMSAMAMGGMGGGFGGGGGGMHDVMAMHQFQAQQGQQDFQNRMQATALAHQIGQDNPGADQNAILMSIYGRNAGDPAFGPPARLPGSPLYGHNVQASPFGGIYGTGGAFGPQTGRQTPAANSPFAEPMLPVGPGMPQQGMGGMAAALGLGAPTGPFPGPDPLRDIPADTTGNDLLDAMMQRHPDMLSRPGMKGAIRRSLTQRGISTDDLYSGSQNGLMQSAWNALFPNRKRMGDQARREQFADWLNHP